MAAEAADPGSAVFAPGVRHHFLDAQLVQSAYRLAEPFAVDGPRIPVVPFGAQQGLVACQQQGAFCFDLLGQQAGVGCGVAAAVGLPQQPLQCGQPACRGAHGVELLHGRDGARVQQALNLRWACGPKVNGTRRAPLQQRSDRHRRQPLPRQHGVDPQRLVLGPGLGAMGLGQLLC